jgi:hypothetical protein
VPRLMAEIRKAGPILALALFAFAALSLGPA